MDLHADLTSHLGSIQTELSSRNEKQTSKDNEENNHRASKTRRQLPYIPASQGSGKDVIFHQLWQFFTKVEVF